MAELTAEAKSSPDCIFGTSPSPCTKSEPSETFANNSPLNPHCPQCGSKKLWRDGKRYSIFGDEIQRWLCRDCGLRFSDPNDVENSSNQEKMARASAGNEIKATSNLASTCQICVSNLEKGTKNLAPQAELKTVVGERERLPEEVRGLLAKFLAFMEREGYSKESQYPVTLKHLAKDGADLLNPENVKMVIAQQKKANGDPWTSSMKMLAVYAYDAFCTMQEISWRKPTYRQNETTLAVPDEKDLDALISCANRKLACFLQCLKETFADPSEILRAEWIDLKDNVLSINHPVKAHYPGKYALSPRLTCMLNTLPRKEKRIFTMKYKTAETELRLARKKAAARLQNPALLYITFKSFRHWGGSMLAHVTNGNVLTIKRILRHKSIQSTMKYIHTIEFKEEDYEETVASTLEEIRQLGKAGWQKYDEMTVGGIQMHFYRRPKRFAGLQKYDDKNIQRSIGFYVRVHV